MNRLDPLPCWLHLIRTRRSIRRFHPRPIEPEKIEYLLEAALRAPSSRSLKPWEFILVTDPEKREALSHCKPHGAEFLTEAPLVIGVCADPSRCDVWIEDASIAAIFIQLAATALGLGSCWVQVRNRHHADGRTSEDYVRSVLEIPSSYQVLALIGVGYPAEQKPPHAIDPHDRAKIHHERW